MIGRPRKFLWAAMLSIAGCLMLVLSAQHSAGQAAQTGKLTVKISGIRNATGNIRVAVRSGENAIVEGRAIEIDPKNMTAETVFNLTPGTYDVVVIHDENKNEKLDFDEVGMPLEGYGYSNNPPKRPGPAAFDETKFSFTASGSTVEINLVYWP